MGIDSWTLIKCLENTADTNPPPSMDLVHAITMAVSPRLTRTAQHLDRFEDLDLTTLIRMSIRGLIVNAYGTLLPHGGTEIGESIIEKLQEIQTQMPICVYSNEPINHPALIGLGIRSAKNVPPKPSAQGFEVVVTQYLQDFTKVNHTIRPSECAMVGYDYFTDGGCRQKGIKFIHVPLLEGQKTPTTFKITEAVGSGIAFVHHQLPATGKRLLSMLTSP